MYVLTILGESAYYYKILDNRIENYEMKVELLNLKRGVSNEYLDNLNYSIAKTKLRHLKRDKEKRDYREELLLISGIVISGIVISILLILLVYKY